MSNFTRLVLIICCLAFQSGLLAHTVIVKGVIKDSNNQPVAGKSVRIGTDSTNLNCIINHTVITNPNGYYIDTFTCSSGDIRKVRVSVLNCDGATLVNNHQLTGTNTIESNFTLCIKQAPPHDTVPAPKDTVRAPKDSVVVTPQASCKSDFVFSMQGNTAKFTSTAIPGNIAGDSIISRTWYFGDTIEALTGNRFDPSHVYSKAGNYNACLSIKTKKGCESKFCTTVIIAKDSVFAPKDTVPPVRDTLIVKPPVNCSNLQAQFSSERISSKKVRFNSSLIALQSGDSIIQRRWKFGDGTILEGKEANPVKEFPLQGIYTVCLRIKTAKGCETEICKQVVVQDSVNLPEASASFVKIVALNPNPVTTRMVATIWSRNNNTVAEIAIYDAYGIGKSTIKKTLSQGNNAIEIATSILQNGSYFLKVSAPGGKDSRMFYKF